MKLLLLLIMTHLFAFHDSELEALWSTIDDINHPTLEDYQRIDRYLATGARPYFDLLRYAAPFRPKTMQRIMDFQLLGSGMPIYEQYDFNIDEYTDGRCILLYGSSNGIYPDKARKLIHEIEHSGYRGHLLLRIGGFPNTPFGGLKICHVPYAFKVAFLQEAKTLGFKEILWIDLAIHPLTDFERVFWEIEQQGYLLTYVGSLQENDSTHLAPAAKALGITPHLYPQIPHISSALIGLNMDNAQAAQLLEEWYRATEAVYPNLTWWPEELSLAVVAWRAGCKPLSWLGDLVCLEDEWHKRGSVQFYLDALR